MKNILEIMKELGLDVPADKQEALNKAVAENYKTVAEFDKTKTKLETEKTGVEEQLRTVQESLKKFDGVNVDELKKQIETANAQAAEKEKEYQAKLDDLEFSGLLDSAIVGARAKNAKAVKALLDIDTLKGSKNRSEDIKTALEAIAKDNDYLFDNGDQDAGTNAGKGTTGVHGENNNVPPTVSDADARAVMGLPPENK